MKTVLFIFCLIFAYPTCLVAQTLKSKVVDAKTNEPLSYISVYLEGTTIGTTTDTQGKFNLKVKDKLFTNLIVSCVGYESAVIENPFETLPEIIYLKEKDYALTETVVLKKVPFSRKQRLKAFREQFLGRSDAGKSCRILNEDSIILRFDDETNILRAKTNVPIEIENPYLGYKISWELIEFALYLKSDKSLNPNNVDSVVILGIPRFEEFNTDSITVNRRECVYEFSQRRFFKLLADGKIIDKDNYILFQDKQLPNTLSADSVFIKYFASTDSSSITHFTINQSVKDELNRTALNIGTIYLQPYNFLFCSSFIGNKHQDLGLEQSRRTFVFPESVLGMMEDIYDKMVLWSQLQFIADTFAVDKYGNTDLYLFNGLRTAGTMSEQRVGDMLPLDYISYNAYCGPVLLGYESIWLNKNIKK